MLKPARAKGIRGSLDLLRFPMASPRTWLEETFEAPDLRARLGAWGMHLDFAPDIAGGALFPYLEAMANQSVDMALGKGGADTITARRTVIANASPSALARLTGATPDPLYDKRLIILSSSIP